MSTPSLLNIPYVIKAGTLYSQIPETGAGDFSVSRTTSPVNNLSTRINADGFIELVNDNVPRLDYPLGGAVNGCPALLVEPAATNLLNSNLSNQFSWPRQQITDVTTIASGFPSPNGIAAYKVIPDTTSNQHRIYATANVGDYNFSVYCKPDGYNFVSFAEGGGLTAANIIFDIQNGTISGSLAGFTPFITPYVDGWYQIGYSRATALTNTTRWIIVRDANNTSNYQGDGVKGVLFAGPQIIAGLPLQSVIFGGANTARSAEVIRNTTATALIGQSEGTIYWEGAISRIDRVIFSLAQGTSVTNFIYLQTLSNGFFRADVLANNSSTCAILSLATATLGQFYKIAFAYKENDFALYINGVLQGSDNLGALPSGLSNAIFARGDSSLITDQRCRAVAIYPNRIPNLDLEFLTAPVTYTTYTQMANALSYILP